MGLFSGGGLNIDTGIDFIDETLNFLASPEGQDVIKAGIESGIAIKTGLDQEQALDREKRQARADAAQVRLQAAEERAVLARSALRLRATQRAAFGGAGLQQTGTPTFVLLRSVEDQGDFVERQSQATEAVAKRLDARAQALSRAADNAKIGGILTAGVNLALASGQAAAASSQRGGPLPTKKDTYLGGKPDTSGGGGAIRSRPSGGFGSGFGGGGAPYQGQNFVFTGGFFGGL